ncbi:MAG: ABC-2 type transport system ATP-binding protein [Verrucomicrobiales bacterium]
MEIRDLRVDYGNFIAVNDISFSVPYGEVFGLVGPNGAGKTSTFSVLATLMEPTYGEVRMAGYDVLEETEATRQVIGYMPDLAPVPSDLKVGEFLEFHADTHGLGTREERRRRVDECLAIVNLMDKRGSWCKQLSRGQTQRVVLAKTLLHRPKVLILDEPASGLDPLSRRDLRIALQTLAREEGATVLVSSHILSELAEMCSSLCVMNLGNLLAIGSAEEVQKQLGRAEHGLRATVVGDPAAAVDWLQQRENVAEINVVAQSVGFNFKGGTDAQVELLAAMMAGGLRVKKFEETGSSFEDILVDVAEGNRES